jgi:succinoglycan biosynthesis protein ExoA
MRESLNGRDEDSELRPSPEGNLGGLVGGCTILMPVLNEEPHIQQTLDAMLRQRFPGELEFLVIDGGSTDRTREMVSEVATRDPRVRLLSNPRRVTPSGLNVGLAHGRWVARMDGHTQYPEDYVLLGVERLAQGGTRWVSGPQIPRGQAPVSRAVALALRSPLGRGGSRKWQAAQEGERELDSGVFAGVWERNTLLEYGGWDERWIRNQDSEMAGRFIARGDRLVMLSAMAASYTPRGSLRALARQYFQYGQYRTKTARRHPQTMRRSHLLAPSLVVAAVASMAGPRHLRKLACGGLTIYASALATASAKGLREAEQPIDAALVPVVLVTMHVAHGLGALRETLVNGPPTAALASAAGLGTVTAGHSRGSGDVFAPSLDAALSEVDPRFDPASVRGI